MDIFEAINEAATYCASKPNVTEEDLSQQKQRYLYNIRRNPLWRRYARELITQNSITLMTEPWHAQGKRLTSAVYLLTTHLTPLSPESSNDYTRDLQSRQFLRAFIM